MTVAELIAELSACEPTAQVMALGWDGPHAFWSPVQAVDDWDRYEGKTSTEEVRILAEWIR